MERILILDTVYHDYSFESWKENEIVAKILFKKCNKLMRIIRRGWIGLRLPFQNVWYQDLKTEIQNAEMVVVHITYLSLQTCVYINKINPDAKVIAWYWNPVKQNVKPKYISGNCEKWSFDPEDCKKYGLKFNHQYYFKSLICEKREIKYDIFFAGSDKGRGRILTEIFWACKSFGIKTKFLVTEPKCEEIPAEIISESVSYECIRENVACSKAVLEIVQNGQSGPTLRTMEALFNSKKLITNNRAIVNEAFYDEKNIFIIGERTLEQLPSFLNCEMKEYDKSLLEQYDVKQWIRNFEN